ncbi:MAG: DNA-binding response OmpR family regulator [Sulfurimonas sp.]|jgi:DNA-binding response OmpR family regulator|uniref:response regulator transcription factor n=1 Tax=Sulfurimonas sp. TaxID=2022749 RepID=UPI0039E4199C
MKKLLILEDDVVLLETLEDELSSDDYSVDVAKHGEEVLDLTSKHRYDLYIFDINVPYINGLSLLKELRDSGDKTAAIFLTSKYEEQSRIEGFEVGCDDYLTKPFSLSELKLRIRAVLRRTTNNACVTFDNIKINLHDNTLVIDEKIVDIDKKTLEILHLLISSPNVIFSMNNIIDKVYKDKIPSHTVIRVHISKINAMFKEKRIQNIRGLGYKYES